MNPRHHAAKTMTTTMMMMTTEAWRTERRRWSSASPSSPPPPPSLLGVWKISASLRSGDPPSCRAAGATAAVPIPRRVRFIEPTASGFSAYRKEEDREEEEDEDKIGKGRRDRLILETGSVAIPYTNHCDGSWVVAEQMSAAGDGAELLVTFTIDRLVESAAANPADGLGPAALASRLRFEGLYDGERIAGTVLQLHPDPFGARVEVADFLCTRLFTFWGTPKVAAAAGHTL